MILKNFRSYQMALDLYRKVEKLKAPHYFSDQIKRAALSTVLNLSEGTSKASRKEKARFYNIALCSHREVTACLDILQREDLLKEADGLSALIYKLWTSQL